MRICSTRPSRHEPWKLINDEQNQWSPITSLYVLILCFLHRRSLKSSSSLCIEDSTHPQKNKWNICMCKYTQSVLVLISDAQIQIISPLVLHLKYFISLTQSTKKNVLVLSRLTKGFWFEDRSLFLFWSWVFQHYSDCSQREWGIIVALSQPGANIQ